MVENEKQDIEKQPAIDISPRAVRIGRILDRLGPGQYTVEIIKPDVRGGQWEIRIVQGVTMRKLTV